MTQCTGGIGLTSLRGMARGTHGGVGPGTRPRGVVPPLSPYDDLNRLLLGWSRPTRPTGRRSSGSRYGLGSGADHRVPPVISFERRLCVRGRLSLEGVSEVMPTSWFAAGIQLTCLGSHMEVSSQPMRPARATYGIGCQLPIAREIAALIASRSATAACASYTASRAASTRSGSKAKETDAAARAL